MPDYDLIVVGAGAKAAGIATKVHIVNSLGLAQISLLVIEGTEFAASWKGRNGMTSGEEPLAVTPIKDIGFPYQSHIEFGETGEAIDAALAQFTWQQHMISTRRYARWVDAGSPQVRHRDYGEYLTWVLSRASEGVKHLAARVTQVTLDGEGERWLVEAETGAGKESHGGGALVLTGPGIHRAFPHEPAVAERVFHCDSRRDEFARIPEGPQCDVAIVGGGESALSATMFLRGMRPDCRYTIYTPMLPMSRGESFLENRVFSNPDTVEWESLDQQTQARLRQALRPRRLRPAQPGGDRLRRALPLRHRPRHRRRRRCLGRRGPARVRGARRGRQQGARLRRQLHRLRPAGAAAHPLPGDGARADRAQLRPDLGPARRQRGADRPQPGARGDAAVAPHPRPGRPQPGSRLRQPRRPRPALQPRAATAYGRKYRIT